MAGGWHDPAVAIMVNRTVLAHRLFTGLSRHHLACLVDELGEPWQAGVEGRRHAGRGGVRKRAEGAGARHQLVFVDRLVATLIHRRHDLPHSVLGLLSGVDRSTVTRAIGEVRTLLAKRGCAVPDRPGLRLRTLKDAARRTATSETPTRVGPRRTGEHRRNRRHAAPSRQTRPQSVRSIQRKQATYQIGNDTRARYTHRLSTPPTRQAWS